MTKDHNRREFLTLAAATAAAAMVQPLYGGDVAHAAAPLWSSTDGADPDLIVHNAKVYTVDGSMPRAEAFAISGGRFIAVGRSSDLRGLAAKRIRIFDAKGMTIIPGFIDCHCHALGTLLLYELLVGNPFEVEFVTIASIIDKLTAKARTTPADTWVEGYFHDDTKVKDKRPLNVRDLDKVSTDFPVAVHHRGGHTSFYNSKAFQLAGITKSTRNPPGGTYDRDANGELTGRVTDTARDVFNKVGKETVFTAEQRSQRERDGLAHISKQFVRYGLTSVHHEGGDLSALQQVRARGDLRHRVSYEPYQKVLDAMIA